MRHDSETFGQLVEHISIVMIVKHCFSNELSLGSSEQTLLRNIFVFFVFIEERLRDMIGIGSIIFVVLFDLLNFIPTLLDQKLPLFEARLELEAGKRYFQ